ncbi:hypothetical protein CS063_07420 [Sporanaerobium hydrogeniformans]|uniref:Uncharacterized protein n=1 Tax=Sporanaerobium hydrogeniformans TaxID=3072179 RepID=A0AC61DEM2_9FIRM|nr:hypothetical protein CS063_07420 [Sporanaerobium hydrogeniformans]
MCKRCNAIFECNIKIRKFYDYIKEKLDRQNKTLKIFEDSTLSSFCGETIEEKKENLDSY